MNDVNQTNNILIEILQFLGRYPVFKCIRSTNLLHLKPCQIFHVNFESSYVTHKSGRRVFGVPIPRYLNRILLG